MDGFTVEDQMYHLEMEERRSARIVLLVWCKEETIPAAQIAVRMTTRNCLNNELQWRAIGSLEAGQSQAEVSRWIQVSRMVVSRLWQPFQRDWTRSPNTFRGSLIGSKCSVP